MAWRVKLGSILFGVSMVLFGAQHLLHATGTPGPRPGPPWTADAPLWAALTGAILILGGVGILTKRWGVPLALMLGGLAMLRAILGLVALAADIHNPQKWTPTFELLALGAASLVLASLLPRSADGSLTSQNRGDALHRTGVAGRYLFAAALLVFGIQHFQYAKFVATLVPVWIPGRLFWSWFSGFAFVATAISLAANRLVRLSGTLLAIMFLSWVLTLHIPRTLGDLANGDEWTSALLALGMVGAGLILAASQDEAAPGRQRA